MSPQPFSDVLHIKDIKMVDKITADETFCQKRHRPLLIINIVTGEITLCLYPVILWIHVKMLSTVELEQYFEQKFA